MNPAYKLIKDRADLSPYLFHFTRGENAFDNLLQILSDKELVSNAGYVCFTETPLVQYMVNLSYMNSYRTPMYSYYGIAFKRDLLIDEYDAKSVIYGDGNDKKRLEKVDMDWRFEELDVHRHDFSWLREWRIRNNFNFSRISPNDMIIISPNKQDLDKLCSQLEFDDMDFSYEPEIGACVAYPCFKNIRGLKGITTEDVNLYHSDGEIEKVIDKIKLGEKLDI